MQAPWFGRVVLISLLLWAIIIGVAIKACQALG
jgi:hypothetical protein